MRYSYPGKHLALDGIDLDIARGEQVVLLGANGSGKSTLLKLLDGIIGPSAGTMTALGRDIATVAAGQDAFRFHREVGLVFQDPDIQLFSATVLDDVAFGPLQLGLSPAEVKAACDDALGEMGIAHLARPGPVRAVRWREEAGGDRLGPVAGTVGRAPRRADRRARSADQVRSGRPHPADGPRRADGHRHDP